VSPEPLGTVEIGFLDFDYGVCEGGGGGGGE
jgi:hypothetical protein